jgi:hypothetical protein
VEGPFGGTLVVGERSATSTRLHLIDARRGCATRRLTVGALVYGVQLDVAGRQLYVSSVEPGTRREMGVWRMGLGDGGRFRLVLPPPTGIVATAVPREASLHWDATTGIASRWCAALTCVARSERGPLPGSTDEGSVSPDTVPDSSLQLVQPRPVPSVAGWQPLTVLGFRWHAVETPPGWMRPALRDAADDARSSSHASSPWFAYDADASDSFRYTEDFPGGGCANAIACASRTVPYSWTVRLRVQGYEFRWGKLRWCQTDPGDGCFDVERTVLHELGHAGGGLQHPEDGGFRLHPLDTVMHSVVPARPDTGSLMHAFGPCDVASLQMRFNLPSLDTPISTCNDVDTRLSLGASASQITQGDALTLRADFSIADRDAYGLLGGDRLNLRSIQLRRRLAGSSNTWTTYWMKAAQSPGLYTLTLRPSGTYEYQALFRHTDDEGLNASASNVITVRVTGACIGNPCAGDEET